MSFTPNNHQMFLTAMIIVMVLMCHCCHAKNKMQSISSEYDLRRNLLTGYDRFVRPVLSPLTIVNVSYSVRLLSLNDVDSKKEIITSKVSIQQSWHNPFLSWNQSLFAGINRIRVSSKEVWVPDIKLLNNVRNPSLQTHYLHENWVTVYSNGTNVWVSLAIMDSQCSFDIRFFPFDEQKCSLIFASESYDTQSLDIHLKQGVPHKWEKRLNKQYYRSISNGEWQAGGLETSRYEEETIHSSAPFVFIELRFSITRIPTFYILYLLCPFVVLSLLVFFSFIIPPENGERIGFCSGLLLSLSVYLLLFSDLMPNNSRNLNIFSVAFVLIFLEAALALIATVLVLKAYHASGQIPTFLKCFLCFNCGSIRKERNEYKINQVKLENQMNVQSPSVKEEEPSLVIKSEPADIALERVDQDEKVKQKEIVNEEDEQQLSWLQFARSLDRLFFWFFFVVFVVTVVIVVMSSDTLGELEISP